MLSHCRRQPNHCRWRGRDAIPTGHPPLQGAHNIRAGGNCHASCGIRGSGCKIDRRCRCQRASHPSDRRRPRIRSQDRRTAEWPRQPGCPESQYDHQLNQRKTAFSFHSHSPNFRFDSCTRYTQPLPADPLSRAGPVSIQQKAKRPKRPYVCPMFWHKNQILRKCYCTYFSILRKIGDKFKYERCSRP